MNFKNHSEHADFLHSPHESGDRNVHQWPWVETAWTVTLTTCFALRSQRRYSSSWMDRVQVSGKETRKIYYRNDPVKYDLNFTTAIPLGFKRFKGTVLGLRERSNSLRCGHILNKSIRKLYFWHIGFLSIWSIGIY